MRVKIKIGHSEEEITVWVGYTDSPNFISFFDGFLEEGTRVVVERDQMQ